MFHIFQPGVHTFCFSHFLLRSHYEIRRLLNRGPTPSKSSFAVFDAAGGNFARMRRAKSWIRPDRDLPLFALTENFDPVMGDCYAWILSSRNMGWRISCRSNWTFRTRVALGRTDLCTVSKQVRFWIYFIVRLSNFLGGSYIIGAFGDFNRSELCLQRQFTLFTLLTPSGLHFVLQMNQMYLWII